MFLWGVDVWEIITILLCQPDLVNFNSFSSFEPVSLESWTTIFVMAIIRVEVTPSSQFWIGWENKQLNRQSHVFSPKFETAVWKKNGLILKRKSTINVIVRDVYMFILGYICIYVWDNSFVSVYMYVYGYWGLYRCLCICGSSEVYMCVCACLCVWVWGCALTCMLLFFWMWLYMCV